MWQSWNPGSRRGSYEAARAYDEQSDDTLTDNEERASMERKHWDDDLLPDPLGEEKDEEPVGLLNDEANAALVERAVMLPSRVGDTAEGGRATVSWLIWPLPSFVHHYFGVRYPEEPRRPTDYLDGLRGVASLCVFFTHYLLRILPNIALEGYAHGDEGKNYSLLQLPFLRMLHSGGAMVAIFFIISGYVLSQRCIVAIRAGDDTRVFNSLTSMTFRRALRLFLPSIAIATISLTFVMVGLLGPEFGEAWTWQWELENFYYHIFNGLLKLWTWEITFDFWYAPQLWTIPTEYRCSLILFLFVMAVARTTVLIRMSMGVAAITYLFYVDRWDVALFLVGMWIAELNIMYSSSSHHNAPLLPHRDATRSIRRNCFRPRKITLGLWAMLIVGLYLAGYPTVDGTNSWGYRMIPEFSGWTDGEFTNYRFWVAIGCTMTMCAITFLAPAQAFFSTPVARYLGKISYALYLVHELLSTTLRPIVLGIFWSIFGYDESVHDKDSLAFFLGWAVGLVAYLPLVVWAADVFWRAIDVPTVKFAKWFEGRCFVR